MLDYVKKLGDERTYNNLKIQYDIFILKESKHIDEIKKKLEIAQRNNLFFFVFFFVFFVFFFA